MSKELTPLEALERLTKIHNYDVFKECYEVIEKSLKALEIIKEALKSENKIGLQDEHFDYVDFDENYLCIDGTISLTEEEFDLLKEVLK